MENSDLVSIDSILTWMRNAVEQKIPIGSSQWLDAAAKLNVLLADVDDEWSQAKFAKAEAELKADKLKNKRDRIVEFIRIAKKRTELREWE